MHEYSLTEAGGYEVRKEGYLPSTVEPFVFKGGITAEMQVLDIVCKNLRHYGRILLIATFAFHG